MKIYNKKSFAEGLFMVAVGSMNLIMDLINHTIGMTGMVLVIAPYLMGASLILRSLSRKFTKEDRMEEMDERNRMIELKSKSRAFRITQIISFFSMLIFLIMGKIADSDELIAVESVWQLHFPYLWLPR